MNYLRLIAIAINQLVNTLLGGWPDETLSSRAHRMRVKGQPCWGWTAKAINLLFFFQKDHCRLAYEEEIKRWQLPPEFRSPK